MARCVNKVIIIGNLTRDPELRYTPQGHAVSSFTIATNREWTSGDGERKEATEFHNVVAWNKLAELCSQLLSKGAKTYVEGRMQTRNWVGNDGNKRYKTEIVIDEMIILSRKKSGYDMGDSEVASAEKAPEEDTPLPGNEETQADEVVPVEDVPF